MDFIALSETGRSNFSTHFLNRLAAGLDFAWYILPPHGRSGGMLVGFNRSTLQVKNVNMGDYSIKFHIRSLRDRFEWVLGPVYGAAQEEKKSEFLSKLVRMCSTKSLPMLVGEILIFFERKKKRIMIILIRDGPSCLT